MKTKIEYLEGLRGVAALAVFIGHLVNAYYPIIRFGEGPLAHATQEFWLAKSPLGVFWEGNTAVCLFFIISGFVLSHRFFLSQDRGVLASGAGRRYLRLALPVLPSVLIACLLMKCGMMENRVAGNLTGSAWLSGFYSFAPSWADALAQGIYRTFLQGSASYNSNLWTMKIEFLGSFLVFLFCALVGKNKYRGYAYIAMFVLLWDTYYMGFIIGMLYSDLLAAKSKLAQTLQKRAGLCGVLWIGGLFLGGYPLSQAVGGPGGTVYEVLNVSWLHVPKIGYYGFYHLVGAAMMMAAILSWIPLQKLFSTKTAMYLGKISFSLYLIHLLVICSFSSWLLMMLQELPYHEAIGINALMTIVLTFFLSHYYCRWIDEPAVKVARAVYERLRGKAIIRNQAA